MYHFYVENGAIEEMQIHITGNDVNHIKNVLRMKTGEEVIISDGQSREFRCKIADMSANEILFSIESTWETEAELGTRLYLFQGLPKKDKMELIVQKAVELGVCEIIPVMTRRTIVKLEDEKKEKKKLERWQAIAEVAAKQSGRGMIPRISEVISFKEAVKKAGGMDCSIIPFEHAKGMDSARDLVKSMKGKEEVGILIGPEGGFDDAEVELAINAGITPISLGRRILRTETAGMTILSVIMFELEE